MADADEDLIPRAHPSSTASNDPSADLDDEAQDFRFLAQLTSTKSSGAGALPRRGEKDFEPNPTQAQSSTLTASREAMHNALSVERILAPRNPLVGQYLPNQKDWRWDVMPTEYAGGKGGRCVAVENFNTTYGRSIGISDFRNWTWLLPEEALFLLERGTLDIRWPDENVQKYMKGSAGSDAHAMGSRNMSESGDDEADESENEVHEDDDEVNLIVKDAKSSTKPKGQRKIHLQVGEVPMSLQAAYASFVGKSGLTLEHYNVYAGLRRLGYIVLRAPTWDESHKDDQKTGQPAESTNSRPAVSTGHVSASSLHAREAAHQPPMISTSIPNPQPSSNPVVSLINRLASFIFTPKPLQYRPAQGPLLYPGLYRNYNDIFRALVLIPYHRDGIFESPTSPTPVSNLDLKPTPKSPFSISWHAYKPTTNVQFRKSDPPPPDFRIAVLDARTTGVPTADQLGHLLDSMPRDELPKEKRMEMRMKHGTRNVILAVVDCGLVSYLRVADVCSGTEGRLFQTKTARGGKRGGGYRGRGRGGKR